MNFYDQTKYVAAKTYLMSQKVSEEKYKFGVFGFTCIPGFSLNLRYHIGIYVTIKYELDSLRFAVPDAAITNPTLHCLSFVRFQNTRIQESVVIKV